LFGIWTTVNLIAWTNIHSDLLLALWPLFGITTALISIFSIYFIYAFTRQEDAPLSLKMAFLILLLPVLLFAHTDLNVSGFNISDCDAFGYEGFWYQAYYTTLGVVAMLWSLYFLVKKYFSSDKNFRKQILLMGIGIEFFLFTFFFITWLASYLTNIGV